MKTRFLMILGITLMLTACSKSPKGQSSASAGSTAGGTASTATMPPTVGRARKALSNIVSTIKSGTAAQIENSFATSTPAEKKVVAAVAQMESLKTAVVAVGEKKIGPQATAIGDMVSKIAPTQGLFPSNATEKLPLVVKGENGIITQGKNMASLYLKNYAGNWKVDFQKTVNSLYPDAATAEQKLQTLTASLGQANQFLQQLQTGLNNGSITSMANIEALAGKFGTSGLPGTAKVKSLLHF